MIDLLVSTVAFSVVVAALLAAGVAVVVLPLYVALQMADARRFSTTRWMVLSGAAVLKALVIAYVLHKSDRPEVLALLPLLLAWTGPAVLSLLDESQVRLGGRAGRHE